MGDGIEEIKVVPPAPGACRICATKHDPKEPHDRDSLYYQNWFHRKYKRFPTWEDAMSHCSKKTKAEYKKILAQRGIVLPDSPAAK